jgi:glycosyltransferase involved in cell wall biosynthesis
VARSIFFYSDSRVLGGAENAMFMLVDSLDRARWSPTLLLDDAPAVEPLLRRAAELGVPVRQIAAMPLGLSGARRVPSLVRLLRAQRPDVFHASMSSPVACKFALTAAVLARVPAVLGTVQVGRYVPPDRSAKSQLRLLARGVDRYLAVSRDIADELVEKLAWPAEKVEVVYNAVDPGRFARAAPPGLREELGGGEGGRLLVLTPARLHEQKGHRVLFEAIAQVPDAVFVLAGDGPERAALEELADRLGIADRIRFLGRREDIPALLAACDVFALPSLYEGSSLAVLEAMAAGLAIVSSAIGGTDELIEDGRSGLLVPAGDPEALAAGLRRVLGDRKLRAELAAHARERVDDGLTREQMAERVAGIYAELLGISAPGAEDLPESRRNAALRRADWRFLSPEAELLRRWRLPRPGGARRARRRLEAEGFTDVRSYWAGPLPWHLPQFWLPVDSPEAVEYLLASRGSGSASAAVLRRLWRLVRRAGLLAPLYLVGRRSAGDENDDVPVPSAASLLLLTGGHRSINKAVGLAFEPGVAAPTAAVKFARVVEAEPGLRREAQVLGRLEAELPDLAGVPRVRGEGQRQGRLAIVEEMVEGKSMLELLSAETFEAMAMRVTSLLVDLGGGVPRPAPGRLVAESLAWFEGAYGSVLAPDFLTEVRARLDALGDLNGACEHRDCSPWNVLLTAGGQPVLLDWESAEPDGLPGLDLVYFLANCTFVLDHSIESGRTRESYASLLDPSTPYGRVAARASATYRAALGIGAEDFSRLRLLCWIIHSRSDYRHLQLEAPGVPAPAELARSMFLGLIAAELERDY